MFDYWLAVQELELRSAIIWGFPKIRGTIWGGPHNKDYSILGAILGSTLGSPYFGKLPYKDRGLGFRVVITVLH